MKGVVLAGGTGSRLFPLTKITNKHLLPIYDRPMIYYPIQTLVDAGVQDIMVVTGGRNSGDFLRLLANGKAFGRKHINYTYQEGEGGIADALALAEHFADGHKICVILGDNIIEGSVREAADCFRQQPKGAHILLKQVHDAERFGVAEVAGGHVVGIEEKPKQPKSNYAVTGIYMYDASVFDKIRTLVPSGRGELEITDVNNAYIREGSMSFSMLQGWWTDAGTFDSLLRAGNLVAQSVNKKKMELSTGRNRNGAGDGMDLMPGGSVVPSRRRLPSLEGLELGLGSLVGSADSPELIAGVNYDWETQRKLSSSE
jgi:glucose-1-phosphate thymidylyltransferase